MSTTPDDDGGGGGFFGGVPNPFEGIGDTISWFQDPAGSTFETLKESASGLVKDVLGQLAGATLPDLSADWFINAYRVSFALGMFVAVVLFIPQLIRTARGLQSGRALAESFFLYFPAFLIGAMFGPMAGWLLVRFFGALTDSITGWGVDSTVNTSVDQFSKLVESTDAASITGGVVMGIVMMLGVIISTFMVMLVLVVQLITLYFTGIILPLNLVWIIDAKTRPFGTKIAGVWLMVLASHPLVFLLLGAVFSMVGAQMAVFNAEPNLQALISLLAAVLALGAAALAPFALQKYAPTPGGASGSTMDSVSSTQKLGKSSMHDLDRSQASREPRGRTSGSPTSSGGSSSSFGESAAQGKTGGAGTGTLTKGGQASKAGATAGAGAKAGTAAASGGTAAAGSAATGAAAAGGAAATATGVGAPIGVAAIAAATAVEAGKRGAHAAKQTQKAAESITDDVDKNTIGKGGTA